MKMPEKQKRHRIGMTLVEAIFVMSFFGAVLGVAFVLCKSGWDSWAANSARVIVFERLRQAQAWIMMDLSESGVGTLTDVPADNVWYSAITFQKPSTVVAGEIVWTDTMMYNLANNHLLRLKDGQSRPVSEGITDFSVRRSIGKPNLLHVRLASSQATGRPNQEIFQSSIDFFVYLRN